MVFCSSLILPISCYKEDLNKQDFYREYCQHDNSEPQSGSLLFNFFPPLFNVVMTRMLRIVLLYSLKLINQSLN